ncbi:MAG: RHS repeat-associated core domain-containing protein, partial [Acidobacteriota bacterium]
RLGNRVSETRDAVTDTYSYTPNACSLADRSCPGNTALLETIALGAGGSRDYTFGLAGHLEELVAGANQVFFDSDGEGRLSSLRRPAVNQAAEMLYDGRSFLLSATEIPAKNVIFRDGFEIGDTGCWSAQVGGTGGTGGVGCFSNEGRRVRPICDSEGIVHVLRARPDVNGTEESTFVFYLAGRPVAQLDQASSSWSFFTTDHLGTPILATDDRGNLLWQGGFEPYGNDWQAGTSGGASENDVFLRLPGQWEDSAWDGASEGAEVYYNVHRWVAFGTGRFTRTDPLGVAGDPNPYASARSNPLAFLDPLGEKSRVCCTPIVLGGPAAVFKHCFIQTQSEPGEGRTGQNRTFGLQRVKGKGCKFENDWFDKGGIRDTRTECGEWSEGCDLDECVEREFGNYPNPSDYQLIRGPNSNSFASTVATACGLSPPLVAGTAQTPGWGKTGRPTKNKRFQCPEKR